MDRVRPRYYEPRSTWPRPSLDLSFSRPQISSPRNYPASPQALIPFSMPQPTFVLSIHFLIPRTITPCSSMHQGLSGALRAYPPPKMLPSGLAPHSLENASIGSLASWGPHPPVPLSPQAFITGMRPISPLRRSGSHLKIPIVIPQSPTALTLVLPRNSTGLGFRPSSECVNESFHPVASQHE